MKTNNRINPIRSTLARFTFASGMGVALFFGASPASAAPPVTTGLIVSLSADEVDPEDPDQVRVDGADIYMKQWNDQTIPANHATQTIESDQPRYIATGLNGLPVLRFAQRNDDDGSLLYLGDLGSLTPSAASIYVVATINNDGRYNLFGNRNDNDERWVADTWAEAKPGSWQNGRDESNFAQSSFPTNGSHVFALHASNTSFSIDINGTSIGSRTGNNYSSGSGSNWTIGNRSTAGQPLNGDIAEILIYDRVLSPAETLQVGAYLSAKYGLVTEYLPQAKIATFGPGAIIRPVVSKASAVTWIVPPGSNLAALSPTFTLSPGATCTVAGTPAVSGETRDFTNPVAYTVTSSDTLRTTTYTVTALVSPTSLAPVTSGLTLHLDASLLPGLNDNDPMSFWPDVSGSGNNAAAGGTPTYKANALNGQPAVRFNDNSRFTTENISAAFGDPTPNAVNIGTLGTAVNGAYVNSPTRGIAGALTADSNTAITLNGANQNVNIPYSAELNSQVFSAEIWARPSTTLGAGQAQAIFSSGEPVAASGRKGWVVYCFGTASGNVWSFRPYWGTGTSVLNGTSDGIDSPVGTADAGNWSHVVVVNDGTDCKLYVNGTLQSSYTMVPERPYVPGGAASGTTIGSRFGAGNQFNGSVDECAFYNTALSAADVLARYNNGLDAGRATPYATLVGASNPVAYYRLAEPAAPLAGATGFIVTTINNDGAYTLVRANNGVDEWWRWPGDGRSYPGFFRGERLESYCAMPENGSHLFAMTSSASAWQMSINGASQGSRGGNFSAGGSVIIGDGSTGGGLNGDIAEVLIYNRTLTALEQNQVGVYLATKYGLSTSYGPPVVVNFTPPDGQTTGSTEDLVVTFNEPINIGTGDITIKNITDNTQIVIDVTDDFQVSRSGAVLTINPIEDLPLGKNYAVQIAAGAVVDQSTLAFPGILDDTTWNFTTAALTPTTIAVVTSGSPSVYGDTVTFTATVDPIPTSGTVLFLRNGFILGSAVPVNTTTGVATLTTSTLGYEELGNEITAEYSGNFQFAASVTEDSVTQDVEKATLTVKALTTLRAINTANPDPLPYEITGFKNNQSLGSSGVTGTPALTTTAELVSPVGDYPITAALGSLMAQNYSFTFEDGTLIVKVVTDTFSINFYAYPGWMTETQRANLLMPSSLPAGFGDWFATGWRNVEVPWGGGLQPAQSITSNKGSSATFIFKDCRNGWSSTGEPRTTNLGVGNYNMMAAGVNATTHVDAPNPPGSNDFDMEITGIPFANYDVIFYMRTNQDQYGDGTGVIKFNGGADRAYTIQESAFNGTFTEMIDATTPGNYIVFRNVTGSSFVARSWGNGFNHQGPAGIQIREATPVGGFNTWATANAPGQTVSQDHDNDGVENGIEYFMGESGSSFTAMPALNSSNEITWPASAAYNGTYEVQTSPDLVNWTNVVPKPAISGGNLSYTLPSGAPGGKSFVRLLVTPAP